MAFGRQEINEETMSIINSLNSKEFIVTTKSLCDLENEIADWIMVGCCGGMVVAPPRTGKTTSLNYIAKRLHEEFGEKYPVIIWGQKEHTNPTEKQFYGSLLSVLGMNEAAYRDTALVLQRRVVNYLSILGSEAENRTIILMIDEASEMKEQDYAWLMDIHNSLRYSNINLFTLLFGTEKLLGMRDHFLANNQEQIVGRFMLKDYRFRGICSREEIRMFFLSFDNPLTLEGFSQKQINCMKYFFPKAYEDGKTFIDDFASEFWDAFCKIQERYQIQKSEIQMQFIKGAFIACLVRYGRGGIYERYFPSKDDMISCIQESSYSSFNSLLSESGHSSTSSKQKKRK